MAKTTNHLYPQIAGFEALYRAWRRKRCTDAVVKHSTIDRTMAYNEQRQQVRGDAMNAAVQLEEALALALKLAPKERLQLIERVAASVERDIEAAASDQPWGKTLVRMLDEAEPIDLVHPEIDDTTEWVKQIRRDQAARRGIDWDEAECPSASSIPRSFSTCSAKTRRRWRGTAL